MTKGQEIALWAGLSAFFGNLVGLKLLEIISEHDAVQIIAAFLISAIVGAAVYSKERLQQARKRENGPTAQ